MNLLSCSWYRKWEPQTIISNIEILLSYPTTNNFRYIMHASAINIIKPTNRVTVTVLFDYVKSNKAEPSLVLNTTFSFKTGNSRVFLRPLKTACVKKSHDFPHQMIASYAYICMCFLERHPLKNTKLLQFCLWLKNVCSDNLLAMIYVFGFKE